MSIKYGSNFKEVLNLNFDSDSALFRLTAAAFKLSVADSCEKFLAVHSSLIEPLPHQISAVYERMLTRRPIRFLLADDPGAGKTIMAGLLIKELIFRGEVSRCLIVCPATLLEQWQEELRLKFQLRFEIFTGDKIFSDERIIASLDTLARNDDLQDKLRTVDWDLIICDEAHKMTATVYGNKIERTKRFRLGQLLGKITRNFLLMTATPHNGKAEDFFLFMSLLDPDRFAGVNRIKTAVDVSDIMRRLVKEDLLTFDGKPLFPERHAHTVRYNLSLTEMKLYELVTAYVADGFNRAERLAGDKKNSVGFAMTILQRRLASSPRAIYQSLLRRTERLKKILHNKNFSDDFKLDTLDDDFPSGDSELREDELAERMTAAKTLTELRSEIQTLQRLTDFAREILIGGDDRKWRELAELLQDKEKISRGDKLIIFTEHRDTLDYLHEKISALFGRAEAVVTIHGGLTYRERRNVQERFKSDENIFVLVATDAAGEGINLQNAHLMINYDLPWNPNRLEQRFGRIHRIGQKKICHLWNLVAANTREGQVFNRLLEKLAEERIALGGKVFDILGKISFDNKPLRELLIEAVRYGDNPQVLQRLDGVVDKTFGADNLQRLFKVRALTADTLAQSEIIGMNQSLTRGRSRKFFVEDFFLAAFRKLGGQIYSRGGGRYEIFHVPKGLRNDNVRETYGRICFDKRNADGAELVTFGHPLLSAVTNLIIKRYGEVLRRGSIFIDDTADACRIIFFVTAEIFDGQSQILSRQIFFVTVAADGKNFSVHNELCLEYRSPTTSERQKILSAAQNLPLPELERLAAKCAAQKIFKCRDDFAARQKIFLDKVEHEVRMRLTAEISFWDTQAAEYNDESATQRADELELRLKNRLAEIALQRKISASTPVVVGKALIVPRTFLADKPDVAVRSRVEKIAMDAVTTIELELGNKPVDVSGDKCGFDIESRTPDGRLRFIEVKGRNCNADAVTVSKNEILAALNSPENFILAIVMVSDKSARVVYLQKPFTAAPDFNAISVNYRISALIRQGKILLDRNILLGD